MVHRGGWEADAQMGENGGSHSAGWGKMCSETRSILKVVLTRLETGELGG